MRRLLVLLLLLATPLSARAETLVAAISRARVDITSNFTGAELAVFGAVERDAATIARATGYDIVVTVRGPRGAVTVREKKLFGPFWLNASSRKYIATPAYVAVLSNRPLDEIAVRELRDKLRVGVDTQVVAQADKRFRLDEEEPEFRSALLRIRRAQGLFSELPDAVQLLTPSLFKATLHLPGTAPLGPYDVEVALFAYGSQLARTALNFTVNKIGSEDTIAAFARRSPLLYGLAAVAIAMLVGWLASVIFRRD
jgi:uncharacterized protein (TIGR02186 family)